MEWTRDWALTLPMKKGLGFGPSSYHFSWIGYDRAEAKTPIYRYFGRLSPSSIGLNMIVTFLISQFECHSPKSILNRVIQALIQSQSKLVYQNVWPVFFEWNRYQFALCYYLCIKRPWAVWRWVLLAFKMGLLQFCIPASHCWRTQNACHQRAFPKRGTYL